MNRRIGNGGADLRGLSLFTGIGGLDLGMELAARGRLSFDAWIESDKDCQETLKKNLSKVRKNPQLLFGDINWVSPEEIMKRMGVGQGELFVVAGGPPCQSFSSAGLRQSLNDDRGSVVYNYFQMIKQLRPRFFIFENVRGLLSAAIRHRPLELRIAPQDVSDDENEALGSLFNKVILPSFQSLGYEMTFDVLNAADYGSAQVRHRVFILGSRDREFGSAVFRKQTSRKLDVIDILPPTHHRIAPYDPIKPWRTVRDAIGHLDVKPKPKLEYTYSPDRAAIFGKIPPGHNWKYIRDNPEKFPTGYLEVVMGPALQSGGGKEGFYRRLSWDRPAPTLTCQPQQLATSLCHPELNRPLSIPEYAAIQDFPEGFELYGSKSSQYKQIGNAVPLRMSAAIGSLLLTIAGERVS